MLSSVRRIGVLVLRLAVAVGIVVAAETALSAQPVYQLHDNGNLWVSTGVPCNDTSCPGWQLLDNNPSTREIAAGAVPSGGFTSIAAPPDAPPLYQRRADGKILFYTGTPCSGGSCPGWQLIGRNPLVVSIVAADKQHLYQRDSNGAIWSYTGTPCSGESCPEWQQLDNDTRTVEIAAAGPHLYQRRNDGKIWRYTGTPCSGTSCPGWQLLDNNPNTREITAAVSNTVPVLYQRQVDGKNVKILRYTGTPCSGASCPGWELLDNDTRTISIVTSSDSLYQLRNDGTILRYTRPPCSGESCPGWQLLDNNPRSRQITAGPRSLYQRHDNGAILRYTGTPCSGESCPGWQFFDTPPTRTIVSTRN